MHGYNVGDQFKNLHDELDLDHHGAERVTPAGNAWRIVEVNGGAHHIVCDATGAWIIPDANELAAEFATLGRDVA